MKSLTSRWFLAAFATVAICAIASAGSAQEAAQQRDVVTNATVIQLHQLGLGDAVILEKLKGAQCSFDTSIAGLTLLKNAGVSDTVISEMLRLTRQQSEQLEEGLGEQSVTTDPNDPMATHEPGIYFYDPEAAQKLTVLEPTVYTATKSGGIFKSAITYGIAKIKSKAVLPGREAHFQIRNRKPTFYFYFAAAAAGNPVMPGYPGYPYMQGNFDYFSMATSANEFVLVKVDVKKKSRELVVGQISAFGAGGGVQDKAVREFDLERIRPGVYKVTPKEDLEPGEYAFFYGGNTAMATYGFTGPIGGGKVYDFGIPK
jgi:hypothetical protein